MKSNIEGKSFLKISHASNDIDVTTNEYLNILDSIGIKPMPPINGQGDGNCRVTIDVHEKVKDYLRNSVYQNSGDDIANEGKDFTKAMDLFIEEIKSNKTSQFVKRKNAAYYTPEKLQEIKNIIEEVNKKIASSRTILDNSYETIVFNEFLESTYSYSSQDTLPKLKIRANDKYGYQIYLQYSVQEEFIRDGKKVKERKTKHLTGFLNRIDEKKLYWSAIFTAMFIYNKIKLGYYIKLNGERNNKWNVISTTPPHELYLIPTLLAYLEHFKENGFKPQYASSLIGNINHLIRFLHPHIPATREIKYEELNHSMKFLDFNYQKVTKFIEYLKKTKTGRTKKPASGRTITNINSNLGNLVTKIIQTHDPAIKNYVNPFPDHDIRVEKREMHPIFSQEQLKKLIKGLRELGDIQLLTVAYIIYYNGCRRIEAERLKIKNIELGAGKIRFYRLEENGRTKTTDRTITMHPDLKKLLLTLELDKYNQEDFLFSIKGVPGENQVSKNYFQKRFQKVRQQILELTEKHGLYGLKHTFSTNFLKSAKSKADLEAKKIQLQEILGHQSFRETMTYIQGLDLSDLFPQTYDGLLSLED